MTKDPLVNGPFWASFCCFVAHALTIKIDKLFTAKVVGIFTMGGFTLYITFSVCIFVMFLSRGVCFHYAECLKVTKICLYIKLRISKTWIFTLVNFSDLFFRDLAFISKFLSSDKKFNFGLRFVWWRKVIIFLGQHICQYLTNRVRWRRKGRADCR